MPLGVPLSFSERLQSVTEAIAAAHTQEDVFQMVLTPALEALSAIAGVILLVDETGEGLALAATQGHEKNGQTLWQAGPLDGNVPAGDALRRREGLFFEHQGALVQAYPELEARTGGVAAVATAVLPMLLDDRPLGALILDFKEPHHFTEAEIRFLRTLAAQCAVALGRAQLQQDLEARVVARTHELEQERAALDAFVAYQEAASSETNVLALARQAVGVVQASLAYVSAAYYELEDGLWKARVWSEDLLPEVAAEIQAGVPEDAPDFREAVLERAAVFVDGWNAQANALPSTAAYGAVAFVPLILGGQVHSLFVVGTRDARAWTAREQALIRAVARGLALTLERTEITRQLQLQNAELDARTRALEAFADLTRDLTSSPEPYTLIQRAQQLVLSLLPDGYALYFEPEGEQWRLRVQTGELRSEALQAVADAGLPYHEADNLLIPSTTHAPYYQDQYAQHTDQIGELVAHLGASETFPVMVEGRPRGVFGVVLFGELRRWSGAERAVMEAVTHALGLALERHGFTQQLQEERAAFEAFSAFTEAAGTQTEVLPLTRQAFEVLLTRFSATSTAVYYEIQGEQFYARSWSEDIDDQPELLAALQGGTSLEAPLFAEAVHTGEAAFTAHWNPEREQIAHTEAYGAAAVYPLRIGGRLRAFLGLGLRAQRHWTDRDAAVLRAVGRGLTLALERAEGVSLLAQSNAELGRSNAELEQFAYIASHDLQAPIRAVTSFAGIIHKRYGDTLDERGRLYLRQIMESGEHMKRLVDDLLTFSRVHTEQLPLLPTDAEAVVDAVARRLQTSGASITRSALPVVQADAQQLDQLLQNLIGNGLKYRRADVAPEVQVSAERDGDFWRFAVADNGIGIEPQYFERIFEIFQRLHGRETYEGTGIGLAVCKKIVERHGGRLWLESTVGEGTTFFFTLPEA